MAVLIGNYNPEVFNTVPNFHDAVESLNRFDIKPILKSIGQLFVKHGVYEKYALISAHRHFNLELNEILVESESSDGKTTLAYPWQFRGTEVGQDSSVLDKGKFVQPQAWIFGDKGDLCPFEFEFTDDPDVVDDEGPSSQFVDKLFLQLKEFGLEKVLGLGLRNAKLGWESTDMATRTNVVKFDDFPVEGGKNDAKLVNVEWAFNSDGGFVENRMCISVIIDGVMIHQEI